MSLHQDSIALGLAAHQQTACTAYRTAGIPGPGDALPYMHRGSRVDEYLIKVDTSRLGNGRHTFASSLEGNSSQLSLGLHTTGHSVYPSSLQSSLRFPINNHTKLEIDDNNDIIIHHNYLTTGLTNRIKSLIDKCLPILVEARAI